jgi:hypothetical protein
MIVGFYLHGCLLCSMEQYDQLHGLEQCDHDALEKDLRNKVSLLTLHHVSCANAHHIRAVLLMGVDVPMRDCVDVPGTCSDPSHKPTPYNLAVCML